MNPSTTINPQQNPSLYENKQGWNILKSGAQMIPTSISSKDLSQVIPIQLPTQPPPTDVGNIVTSNNYGIATGLTGFSIDQNGQFVPQPAPTTTPDQTKEDTGTTGRLSNLRALLGLAPKQENVLSNPDVVAKNAVVEQRQQEVNNATAQLNAITARQQQAQLMLNNRLDKETGLSSEQKKLQRDTEMAKINYDAAIEALPVQASIAAAQGNLSLAQQSLDNLTRIKTENIKNEYDYQKSLYDSIRDFVSKEESIDLKREETKNERSYQEKQQMLKTENELLKSAASQGAPASVLQAISNAKTTQEMINVAGVYAGDILDRQVKLAQIEKLKAEASDKKASNNVIARISNIDPNSPTYISDLIAASAGGAKLTGDQTRPISKALTVVGQIDSLQKTLENADTGPIVGIFRSANPYDVQAQLIKAQLQAIIPNLARGVYGEVGVLTDNDIANYRKTIGNLKSPKELNDLLLAMTLKTVQNGIDDQLEVAASAGRDVSGFAGLRNRLTQRVNELNAKLGVTKETTSVQPTKADLDYINSLPL